MNNYIDNKITIIRHSILWLLLGCVYYYQFNGELLLWQRLLIISLRLLSQTFAYYSITFIAGPKITGFSLRSLIIIFLIFVGYSVMSIPVEWNLLFYFYQDDISIFPKFIWLVKHTVYFILILMLAIAYYRSIVNLKIMKEQKSREQVRVRREIGFLRNQFNHHISFNFLNYCYSIARNQVSVAAAIDTYSIMLRYTLDIKIKNPVPLSSELVYIDKYISLQKLLNNSEYIIYEIDGNYDEVSIYPMILINFIENAFKYGIKNNPDKPIEIKISVLFDRIVLYVKNYTANNNLRLGATGKGQGYAINQLNIHYNENYELSLENKNEFYLCSLIIRL
jgi:Histidine kinase